MNPTKSVLVIGLGNDILADDAVGLIVARELEDELSDLADVEYTPEHGVVLLDYFIGYEKAVIVDAIVTGENPPGTLIEIDPKDLLATAVPSPHYTGIPELFMISQQLGLEFPHDVRIIAMEIADPLTVGGEMTREVTEAIPAFKKRVIEIVNDMTS